MRINSGILKGRKLSIGSRKSGKIFSNLRPTEGVIKEAVISILRMDLYGAVFLDLFAGSGAIGFEVYSNGADKIYFIEKVPQFSHAIKVQATEWGVNAEVLLGDYRTKLQYLLSKDIKFDYVYIDPPYHIFSYDEIIKQLECTRLFKVGGYGKILIERHNRSKPPSEENLKANQLSLERSKRYGSIVLDIINYLG